MLLSQFPAEEEVVRLEGEVRCLTKAGNELGLELQGLRDKERELLVALRIQKALPGCFRWVKATSHLQRTRRTQ